jgi:GrpB-like predicted nucleotidyltransferase (UPF0157 family)
MTPEHSLHQAIHESVRLEDYDRRWPTRFARERVRLLRRFPDHFLAIEHFGSTAVPGLRAKPIIDILAGVESMAVAIALNQTIGQAGYTTLAEFNAALTDRQWFMKWSKGHRTHHLHVVEFGGDQWRRRLRFREALRSDERLALAYSRLKETLALQHPDDRDAYTEGKADFVEAASG